MATMMHALGTFCAAKERIGNYPVSPKLLNPELGAVQIKAITEYTARLIGSGSDEEIRVGLSLIHESGLVNLPAIFQNLQANLDQFSRIPGFTATQNSGLRKHMKYAEEVINSLPPLTGAQ